MRADHHHPTAENASSVAGTASRSARPSGRRRPRPGNSVPAPIDIEPSWFGRSSEHIATTTKMPELDVGSDADRSAASYRALLGLTEGFRGDDEAVS